MFRFTSARRAHTDPAELRNLAFSSVDIRIPAAHVRDCPSLMTAAVDDLCWQFTLQAWKTRHPARGRKAAYAAWVAELQPLLDTNSLLRNSLQEQMAAL